MGFLNHQPNMSCELPQKGKVVFQPPFFEGYVKLRGVSFFKVFGRWISRVSDVSRQLAGDYTDRLVPEEASLSYQTQRP